MSSYTAHIDTFARDNLPPRSQWPEFRFDLPQLKYPDRLNCASVLLDDAIKEGHARRPALFGSTEVLTYGELYERTQRIANVLVKRMGVVPGTRVLLRGSNSPMFAALWLAVVRSGAIVVATMPLLRAKELATIATKAAIDYAFCEAGIAAELRLAAAQSGRLGTLITYGDGQLESLMERESAEAPAVATSRDDVCVLAFTSGTTGAPKATMHFHRDVLVMADVVGGCLLETTAEDVHLGSPPLGFTFGLGGLLVIPLRFRAAGVLLEQTKPDALLSAIARYRVTCLFTAPTMYRTLAANVGAYDISTLRTCVSAGEALSKATSDLWYERTRIRLTDGIGATEMMHIFIGAKGADVRPGATGLPLPGYEACILDAENRPLPRGSTGRLAVKGPTGCRYLADERQAQYVIDGWNVTGDLYHVDADGYFWFVARADDMIVSAGYNLSAVEIEAALLEHPAVAECAVVGVPDAQRGQVAKAFVVLAPSFEPGAALAAQLQESVKQQIAPYKYPRLIEFIAALPRTSTGKVQRNVLRQRSLTERPTAIAGPPCDAPPPSSPASPRS